MLMKNFFFRFFFLVVEINQSKPYLFTHTNTITTQVRMIHNSFFKKLSFLFRFTLLINYRVRFEFYHFCFLKFFLSFKKMFVFQTKQKRNCKHITGSFQSNKQTKNFSPFINMMMMMMMTSAELSLELSLFQDRIYTRPLYVTYNIEKVCGHN